MATRFVKGSYQEIIDLHTESDHVTALGIHTPTGTTPRQMFKGFFDQYKKYKYLGCSIKLVPAARLPADPLAVSYDAGEPTIDPRDMLNPLMFHGCHGNDLGTILNRLYGDNNEISDSVDGLDTFGLAGGNWIQNPNAVIFNEVMERLYYKALTDNTWKKAHPQRGFMKKGLHPLVYSMATNRQLMPGSLIDTSDVADNGDMSILGADPTTEFFETNDDVRSLISRNGIQFFTPKLTSLGWMDTRNELTSAQDLIPVGSDLDDIAPSINNLAVSQINFAELPKIYMGVILLPPAYKTEQYYRMVVNHRFAFKGFRGISFMPEVGNVPSYYNANSDLFSPDQYGSTTTSGGGSTGGDMGGGSGGGSTEPEPEPDPEPEPEPEPVVVLSNYLYRFKHGVAGYVPIFRTMTIDGVSYTGTSASTYSCGFAAWSYGATSQSNESLLIRPFFNDNGTYYAWIGNTWQNEQGNNVSGSIADKGWSFSPSDSDLLNALSTDTVWADVSFNTSD